MCVEVKFNGKFASNHGELKELLGIDKLPLEDCYKNNNLQFSDLQDSTCLCPINIPKAAEMINKKAVATEDFDWEIV